MGKGTMTMPDNRRPHPDPLPEGEGIGSSHHPSPPLYSPPEGGKEIEGEGTGEDRTLAEDLSLPVVVEPGVDYAQPPDWNWRDVDSSQPNAAVFHISHSEITRVLVDTLRPEDSSPDANMVIKDEIPIVVLDSLDKYWAGEAKHRLPLNGVRVPIEGDTLAEAKRALADDLAAQFRLLLMLRSSAHRLAQPLQENLLMLSDMLEPRRDREGGG